MVKRSSILNARVERLKVPQVTKRPQKRAGRIRDGVTRRVSALLLDITFANPVGDEQGRDTATQTVEGERVLLAARGGRGVCQVVWTSGQRRGHMVVETASLVKGDDEQGVVPLRTCASSVVYLADQSLAVRDQACRVHGVRAHAAAGWVDVGELGQRAGSGVGVELLQVDDLVLVTGVVRPVEVSGIRPSATGIVPVVDPRCVGPVQGLPDGNLGEAVVAERVVVVAVAIRGARDESSAVGIGGLTVCKSQFYLSL